MRLYTRSHAHVHSGDDPAKAKGRKEGQRRRERARKTRDQRVGENKRQDEPRARKSSWIRVGAAGAAGWLAAGGSELEKNLISGERIQTAGRR